MSQNAWKAAVAEMIGTFALVFMGAGSILADALTGGKVGITGIALAHGLAIAAMVSATGHISGGHLNPAVTAAFVATGRLPVGTGLTYLIAQLVGASLAAFFLAAAFPEAVRKAVMLGTPALNPNITAGTGIIVEAILTFFLVFTVFGTAVDGRGPKMGGLFIGLALTMAIVAGGALTGAALNPARAFGPALFSGMWGNHLVYWVGPIIGGVLAGWIYHGVFKPS